MEEEALQKIFSIIYENLKDSSGRVSFDLGMGDKYTVVEIIVKGTNCFKELREASDEIKRHN